MSGGTMALTITVLIFLDIVFYFIPTFIIGRRMGLSAWWMLFWLLPLAGLWILAVRGWPTLKARNSI